LVAPPLNVAGPAIEALKYTGSEASLREMYINLLSTSMDSETTKQAHPSFVEIIRQLTPDEARLLSHVSSSASGCLYTMTLRTRVPNDFDMWRTHMHRFSEYEFIAETTNADLMSEYLDNLCRLGMFAHPTEMYFNQIFGEHRDMYTKFLARPSISDAMTNIQQSTGQEIVVFCEIFHMTTFGEQFARACIIQPTP
jgi:Abortive infection alpha